MNVHKLKIFSFLSGAGFSMMPLIMSAALVPCGPGSESGLSCSMCDLITLAKNIVNFGIGLSVVMGVVFLIWGGFLILTGGSSDRIKSGRSAIFYAITGLIIVLGAWLIIDTTLRIFMGSNSPTDWGPWNTFPSC